MNLDDHADHFDTHIGPHVAFYQKISCLDYQLFFDYQMVQVKNCFRKIIFTQNRICSPSFIKIEQQLRKLDFILGSLPMTEQNQASLIANLNFLGNDKNVNDKDFVKDAFNILTTKCETFS